MIYENSGIVEASMCDTFANISDLSIVSIVQNAAASLLGLYKLDNISLKIDYSSMWVFVKNRIRFFNKIKWNEKYNVKCFLSYLRAYRATIDVCITSNDKIVAYSKLEVVSLDINSKKMVKLDSFNIEFFVYESLYDINYDRTNYMANKLISKEIVKSQSIDFSHHTNNVMYVRYVLDSFNTSYLERNIIEELEINYLNESFEGDLLEIYSNDSNEYFNIVCNNNIITKVLIKYKN